MAKRVADSRSQQTAIGDLKFDRVSGFRQIGSFATNLDSLHIFLLCQ